MTTFPIAIAQPTMTPDPATNSATVQRLMRDAMLEGRARAHAGINNCWVALSGPAQTAHLLPAELIGPHGEVLARASAGGELIVAHLDGTDRALEIAQTKARTWRTEVTSGDFHRP